MTSTGTKKLNRKMEMMYDLYTLEWFALAQSISHVPYPRSVEGSEVRGERSGVRVRRESFNMVTDYDVCFLPV